MKRKNLLLAFLLVGAISMLIMSLHYFGSEDSGILLGKSLRTTPWYRISFFTHITAGLFAITLGPFQFSKKLLKRHPNWHRRIGYGYVVAVTLASFSGLLVAPFAMGGILTQLGFSVLSLLWMTSLYFAVSSILSGNVEQHKKWMTVNYALTFAAITQRTILLFAFLPALDFLPVYRASAWLCWMINLSLVLLYWRVREKRTYQRVNPV
jgi:uncharacterized membrane protein